MRKSEPNFQKNKWVRIRSNSSTDYLIILCIENIGNSIKNVFAGIEPTTPNVADLCSNLMS